MATAYPVEREIQRLRRWLETAGAEYRLVSAVAASPSLREQTEAGIAAGGGVSIVHLDVRSGEVVPEVFRNYRGSHSSYRLFAFHGLAERVAAEGAGPLAALEAAAGSFRRPATWSLLWLDDPALLPLLRRRAPRLWAGIQLRPTFAAAALAEPGSSPARALLAASEPDLESRLLAEADRDLAAGDAQAALATLAAAAAAGGARRGEALAGMSAVLARLGDGALARRLGEEAAKCGPGPAGWPLLARARLTLSRREGLPAREAVAAARDAAAGDPAALGALAAVIEEAGDEDKVLVEECLREARDAALEPAAAAAAGADLGLFLARPGAGREAEAEAEAALAGALAAAGTAAERTALRARRGLARLRVSRAASAGDTGSAGALFAEADRLLEQTLDGARAKGDADETVACLWERVAAAAAREDLGLVLGRLEEVLGFARGRGLRPLVFEALEKHARALRFARELARATGELDEIEALAYDLTWPDLEVRAFAARGDHLREIGIPGEARSAYRRAVAVAAGMGDDALAAELGHRPVE